MIHTVESVIADIQGMTDSQLNEVSFAIKQRRQRIVKQNIRKLMVGDIVSFESSRTGKTTSGRVRKIGRKWVQVDETGGPIWKVPANMLTPLNIGG
jgi:putative ribosome biogenesis GTPase RsgA